jgi:hypothetical protein
MGNNASIGVFFDVAHNAGIDTFGAIAMAADELDFVSLE